MLGARPATIVRVVVAAGVVGVNVPETGVAAVVVVAAATREALKSA